MPRLYSELIESLGSSLAPVIASLTRLEITAEARTPNLAYDLETESDPSTYWFLSYLPKPSTY